LLAPVPLPPRRLWLRIVVAGLLGQTLYQLLLMTGEVRVSAGTAAVLIATAPVFAVVAAAVALHEPVGRRWWGVGVAFAGAGLVGASLGLGGGAAALLVLGAALCQGLFHVVVKPLAQELGAVASTAWTLWAGAALLLPALPAAAGAVPGAAPSAFAAAVYLGLVPTALGFVTWTFAVGRTSVARATVSLYLVPVVAMAIAWAWLGERPAPAAVAGGALAVAGVVLVRRVPVDRGERSGRGHRLPRVDERDRGRGRVGHPAVLELDLQRGPRR
jgi:drug/metabolite transporter (DMT)-like permease